VFGRISSNIIDATVKTQWSGFFAPLVGILFVAGVTLREAESSFWLPTVRSLPLSLRFAGLSGEIACLLSREHSYDFVLRAAPSFPPQ
jgi:hypothetical protein